MNNITLVISVIYTVPFFAGIVDVNERTRYMYYEVTSSSPRLLREPEAEQIYVSWVQSPGSQPHVAALFQGAMYSDLNRLSRPYHT